MIDLRDLLLFIKRPNLESQFKVDTISYFVKLSLKSFLILFLIDLVNGLTIVAFLKHFNLYPPQSGSYNGNLTILKLTLLFPIVEELIFRLPLRFSRFNLSLSSCLILFLLFNKQYPYLSLTLPVITFLFLFLVLREDSNILRFAEDQFKKHLVLLFYFQALIFGFLHLANFNLDLSRFYLFPLLILNFVFSGLIFGYLRVKYNYGIYVCIATHIVNNYVYLLVH
jgi:hypothetical protein